MPHLSSLPARVDPADWLDEELPVLGAGVFGAIAGRPDLDGLDVGYSPVAELDAVEVMERASAIAPLAASDAWDVESSGTIENFAEFRICQHKLNR